MNSLSYLRKGSFLLLTGLALASLSACAEKAKGPPENRAADHLRKIAQSFDLAQYKNGRPPKDADDIKPFLKQLNGGDESEDRLRSPNDGEPYEIIWGVNLDRQTDTAPLLAYEKKGKDGKRYVVSVARIVMQLSDAEFAGATFAKGKR